MESIKMKFKVDRRENNETVNFLIPDLENSSVNITDNNTQEIENLFNLIFQEIIQRQKLIEFDLATIREAKLPVITPVIVTNTADFDDVLTTKEARVNTGDYLLTAVK